MRDIVTILRRFCDPGFSHLPGVIPAMAAAADEIERLRRDYSLLEELAPPDVPRREFVRWCLDAWEEKCKWQQALLIGKEPADGE